MAIAALERTAAAATSRELQRADALAALCGSATRFLVTQHNVLMGRSTVPHPPTHPHFFPLWRSSPLAARRSRPALDCRVRHLTVEKPFRDGASGS